MNTQIGYEQLRYAVWTVSYSNQIASGYAQNPIWADSLNKALELLFRRPGLNRLVYLIAFIFLCHWGDDNFGCVDFQ